MLDQEVKSVHPETQPCVIGIDRLCIGYQPPNPFSANLLEEDEQTKKLRIIQFRKLFVKHSDYVKETLATVFEDVVKVIPCKNIGQTTKRYLVYSQDSKKNVEICTFFIGSAYGTPFMNFEFNPSRLTPETAVEVKCLLECLFDNAYEEIFACGVVSRAEIYLDVLGVKKNEIFLMDFSRRNKKSVKETSYQGGSKAEMSFAMYDKARKSTPHGSVQQEKTRIELRVKNRKMPLRDLSSGNLKNPFSSIRAIPVSALSELEKKYKIPCFANAALEVGINRLCKNKYGKRTVYEFLSAYTFDWWDSDQIWCDAQTILKKIAPYKISGNTSIEDSSLFSYVL